MASFAELKEKARFSACLIRDDKERLEFAQSFLFATTHRFWEAVQRSSEPAPPWSLPDFLGGQQVEPLAGTEWTVLSLSIADLVSGFDAIEAGYCLGGLYTALIPDNLRSQYGVYYTPPVLVERLMDMAEAAGVDWSKDTVLDPACGGGAFLAPIWKGALERRRKKHIVFGNLDAWLLGIHHGVSSKHLQAYLNEFVFRFNRRFWPVVAFKSALAIATKQEAPTYDGLYDGTWAHPGGWISANGHCSTTG